MVPASTQVGYAQGETESPTYEQVCSGATGHTEAVQVVFNPSVVSYERLCSLLIEVRARPMARRPAPPRPPPPRGAGWGEARGEAG